MTSIRCCFGCVPRFFETKLDLFSTSGMAGTCDKCGAQGVTVSLPLSAFRPKPPHCQKCDLVLNDETTSTNDSTLCIDCDPDYSEMALP